MGICVNDAYIESKIDELHLALEYQIKKKEEKELQRELRAQQREAARLKKEIEEERKKINKREETITNKLSKIFLSKSKNTVKTKSSLLKSMSLKTHYQILINPYRILTIERLINELAMYMLFQTSDHLVKIYIKLE